MDCRTPLAVSSIRKGPPQKKGFKTSLRFVEKKLFDTFIYYLLKKKCNERINQLSCIMHRLLQIQSRAGKKTDIAATIGYKKIFFLKMVNKKSLNKSSKYHPKLFWSVFTGKFWLMKAVFPGFGAEFLPFTKSAFKNVYSFVYIRVLEWDNMEHMILDIHIKSTFIFAGVYFIRR